MATTRSAWAEEGGWCGIEALLRAWREARRGKRHRPDVALFERDAERRLVALGERLRARTWRPSAYRVFTVHAPVVRTIAALPFEDRVVQHALMAVVAPRIVRTLTPQTWACLPGRGSHAALAWVAGRCTERRWCLRLDVRKFFPSIDYAVLGEALRRLRGAEGDAIGWAEERLLAHPGPFEKQRSGSRATTSWKGSGRENCPSAI